MRGENLRFFPELRHRVAKMLRVLAYDSGGAALPELLRPGKEGCVPWLVAELGNSSTHWCTRAELAAVLGSLARIPALSAAMVRKALSPILPIQEKSKISKIYPAHFSTAKFSHCLLCVCVCEYWQSCDGVLGLAASLVVIMGTGGWREPPLLCLLYTSKLAEQTQLQQLSNPSVRLALLPSVYCHLSFPISCVGPHFCLQHMWSGTVTSTSCGIRSV